MNIADRVTSTVEASHLDGCSKNSQIIPKNSSEMGTMGMNIKAIKSPPIVISLGKMYSVRSVKIRTNIIELKIANLKVSGSGSLCQKR